jgi:acetyltransferase
VQHERLTRICFVDYDRTIALVVSHKNEAGEQEIVAAGRLSRTAGNQQAEYAIVVSDAFQGIGIGTRLLHHLLLVGKEEGIETVVAYMLPENRGMRHISQKLGFEFERESDLIKAYIHLADFDASALSTS